MMKQRRQRKGNGSKLGNNGCDVKVVEACDAKLHMGVERKHKQEKDVVRVE